MEFWEIYDRDYARVRKFIQGLVKDESIADDLIQETFLRVQKSIDSLKEPSKISSWIFRIAYNLCQDHFRRSKRVRDEVDMELGEIEDDHQPCIQKELEQRQMGKCVQDQMDLLPEPLRIALFLSDIMEMNHQEIAETLGITPQNAKVRLHRARKKLKPILEGKCSFEFDERNVLVCEPKERKKKD